MNNIKIRKIKNSDVDSVKDIFNHFCKSGFACYREGDFTSEEIKNRMNNMSLGYVAEAEDKVIGFGYVSPYKNFDAFANTGVLTYFILPEYTGTGIGSKFLNTILENSRVLNINNFLAHISSKNEPSLSFHKKHGFEEVGRFKKIAKKFGEKLDIIWVQKILDDGGGNE